MENNRLPTYFISHGGGPWPWLEPDAMPVNFALLGDALAAIPGEIGVTPRATVIISAHWEEEEFTVQTTPEPPMIYDYYGFPQHTYEIEYAAQGDAEVSARVVELLTNAAIPVHTEAARGYDHGVYAPMYKIYPKADVPVVQLSLRQGLDPAEHVALGRALAPLRDENILLLGSGVPSFHNMGARDVGEESRAFDAWLTTTMTESSPEDRVDRLLNWERAPFARINHPREEHFIPGLVIAGAAGSDVGLRHYHEENVMGWMSSSGYRFDPPATA